MPVTDQGLEAAISVAEHAHHGAVAGPILAVSGVETASDTVSLMLASGIQSATSTSTIARF
jgi:hypothetical protein